MWNTLLRGFLYYEPQFLIMKKLSILIAGLAIMLLSVSAFSDKRREAALGNQVPSLVLGESDSIVSLESLKGKWVILSFWSAADAFSRMSQNEVSRFSKSLQDDDSAERIEFVSVNLDRSKRLMQEIVKLDNLDSDSQLHISDPSEEIELRNAFRMNEGLRTFIINPEGVLVEADPTYESLRAIVFEFLCVVFYSKANFITWWYSSPGFSLCEGNPGWFGASGHPWHSMATAA